MKRVLAELRQYLSCPPPLMIGSNRTRGLLRTYNAPIPTANYIVFDT